MKVKNETKQTMELGTGGGAGRGGGVSNLLGVDVRRKIANRRGPLVLWPREARALLGCGRKELAALAAEHPELVAYRHENGRVRYSRAALYRLAGIEEETEDER